MAARKDKATVTSITFGGKVWTVGALTWEQLAAIFPALTELHSLDQAGRVLARLRVIVAALEGQATEAELRLLPTGVDEIFAASEVVADISGFVRLGEHLAATAIPSKAGTSSSLMPAPAPDGLPAKSAS